MRLRLTYLLLAIVCIGIGLLLRWPVLGLPWVVGKYGGSALWAAMVYLGLRVFLPTRRVEWVAILAAVIAALGEATQLLSVPGFDQFRDTVIGHLIFGRTFAVEDIIAYWLGIALVALADAWVQYDGVLLPIPRHSEKPRRCAGALFTLQREA